MSNIKSESEERSYYKKLISVPYEMGNTHRHTKHKGEERHDTSRLQAERETQTGQHSTVTTEGRQLLHHWILNTPSQW